MDITDNKLTQILSSNLTMNISLTRLLLPIFNKRQLKSAIINFSSFNAEVPCCFYALNAGNNAFIDIFSRSIAQEYKNVDFTCMKPLGLTRTNAGRFVKACLRNLGYEKSCYGDIEHQFQAEMFKSLTEKSLEWYYSHFMRKHLALDVR